MIANEPERLAALDRYALLDTPSEPAFDELARLAALVCAAPMALVSLVDESREWFKANIGLAAAGFHASSLPRAESFCAHAIAEAEPLIVPDAARDDRFRCLGLVTGPVGVRFYAGVQLRTAQGHAIGALSVLDRVPRALAPDQLDGLRVLAARVMVDLELRLSLAEGRRILTERDAMQVALERERAFLRRVIDTQPSMVFVKDWEGRFVLVNEALARCYGTTVDGIVGRTDAELNPDAEEVSHFVHDDRQVMSSGRPMVIPEEPVTNAQGEVRWFSTVKVPLPSDDGSCRQVLGVATDITAQRQALAALRESERLHRTLGDVAPGFVWTVGPDGRFEWVNRTWEEFTGSTMEELNAGGWQQHNHPDDLPEVERRWAGALAQGTPFEMELRYRRRDGTYRWMLARVVPVRDEAGVVSRWVGSAVDIEEMKQVEAARRASEERLRQAQRLEAVGRLAGGVAHDLNNMLLTILGNGEFVAAALPAADPRRQDVEAIIHAAGRSAALTRQLLAFARRDLVQPRRFDLNALVRNTRQMLEVAVGEAIAFELRLAEGELPAFADPTRIEQVLVNLVINARDAMPQGGRLLVETAHVQLDASYPVRHPEVDIRLGPYVRLSVSDTGHGMDPGTMAHIFEPFFTTKPIGEGTGLGLAMAYGSVKQAGGLIWPYSEPGQGSVFKVYLPAATDAVSAERAAVLPAPDQGRGERILVVDDDEGVRGTTCRALARFGYHCMPAAGGAEALARLQAGMPVDLVITDLVMPGLSGRELAERIEHLRPGLPIIFVSGYTEEDILQRGLLEQGRPFLAKPFRPDAIAGWVAQVLDRGRTGR